MDGPVSILKLTSAMARHAAHMNSAAANNMARADIPGATSRGVEVFRESLRSLEQGEAPRPTDSRQLVSVEREMLTMAEANGRHQAALAVWKSTLNMMRLAVRSPQ